MAREYTNTECPLHGTRYCSILNMPNCDECTITARERTTGIESVKTYIDKLEQLMPEGGISELFTKDTCLLCKGEPNKKSCYALLDMGNEEPRSGKRSVLSVKAKVTAGAIVPVQIACCNDCRKRFKRISYIQLTLVSITMAVVMLLLSIRPINEALKAIWMWLPAAVFVGMTVLSVVVGALVRNSLCKKYSSLTHLDVFELPKLHEMKEKGWFQLTDKPNKYATKLVFSDKRVRRGVFTGKVPPKEQPVTAGEDAAE